MSGKIINFTKIAREVGVDVKTVQLYYLVLEETYLGIRLPSFHKSIRKSQLVSPKFYLFDIGVKRALEQALHGAPTPGTSYYGELFEQFVILEFVRMNLYCETDYRLSYFATKEGIEVDLVLSRGNETIFIEIKSSPSIDPVEVKKLASIAKGHATRSFYLSESPNAELMNDVRCLHWREGLKEIFQLGSKTG
jgi:predicted AAA+ superfamily ATPase